MVVKYPSLADGCAYSDVPELLARYHSHNSPMANYIPPPSPSFGQVKSSLINKDNLIGYRPAFDLRFSAKHMKHSRVNDYPETQFKRAQMADHHMYFVLQYKLPYCDCTQYFIQYKNSYLNIFQMLVFQSVRVLFERDPIGLFHLEPVLLEDAINCGQADGIYPSKLVIVFNHYLQLSSVTMFASSISCSSYKSLSLPPPGARCPTKIEVLITITVTHNFLPNAYRKIQKLSVSEAI